MDKFFDKDGNDITEAVKKQFEDASAPKFKELNDKLIAKDGEIAKFKEKDTNFENLKTGYETQLADTNKKLTDFQTSMLADKRAEAMKKYTGGNKDAMTKIEAELKALNLPMDNAENIEIAIKKASLIAAPEVNPLNAAGSRMGGRGAALDTEGNPAVETNDQRSTRLKFGITDAMAAKYTPAGEVAPLIVDKPKA